MCSKEMSIFLCHIAEISHEKVNPRLEDYPILQEFKDVFLEKIPGLSPRRKIDFTVKLVPRDVPIEIAAMVPLEKRSLMKTRSTRGRTC